MTHPLIVRRDLDFLLHDWLKMETLFAAPAFADHSRESVDAVLDLSEAHVVLAHARHGPSRHSARVIAHP